MLWRHLRLLLRGNEKRETVCVLSNLAFSIHSFSSSSVVASLFFPFDSFSSSPARALDLQLRLPGPELGQTSLRC